MLTQVHFENIKALANVTVDLNPFTLLVGPNGCGKSTLLDQIDVLCRMFQLGKADQGAQTLSHLGGPRRLSTHNNIGSLTWSLKNEIGATCRLVVLPGADDPRLDVLRFSAKHDAVALTADINSIKRNLPERSLRLTLDPRSETW